MTKREQREQQQKDIQEVKEKISNNKHIIMVMTREGNEREVEKAKKHLAKNEKKLEELSGGIIETTRQSRGVIIDKLELLQEEWYELRDEYVTEYGGSKTHHNWMWTEPILQRLKEIETVFRNLDMHPTDKI